MGHNYCGDSIVTLQFVPFSSKKKNRIFVMPYSQVRMSNSLMSKSDESDFLQYYLFSNNLIYIHFHIIKCFKISLTSFLFTYCQHNKENFSQTCVLSVP